MNTIQYICADGGVKTHANDLSSAYRLAHYGLKNKNISGCKPGLVFAIISDVGDNVCCILQICI